MVDYKSIQFDNHTLASGAVYLVNKIRLKQNWEAVHKMATGLSDQAVRPCAKFLCFLIQNAENNTLTAVKRKFGSPEHFQVSKLKLERNQ